MGRTSQSSRQLLELMVPGLLIAVVSFAAHAQNANLSAPVIVQNQRAYVEGEVIVKLRGTAKSTTSRAFVGRMVGERAMKLKGTWSGLNMHQFQVPAGSNIENTVAELQKDPTVEYVEPNYLVYRLNASGAEDVRSMDAVQADSSSVSASSAGTAQTAAPIQLSQAWSSETASATPPIVAVIDTGLDLTHSVFVNSGAIWTNAREIAANHIDDDSNGFVDDVHGWNFVSGTNSPQDDDGHGTHVSGIILGTTMNITASPIGQAPIRIMPVKFLDNNGSGSTADAVQAIYYAVNNGAKVLNNSWGGSGYSSSLFDAINYAYNSGAVFVAAAGNASSNNDSQPTYPANYAVPNMMSIAATDDADGFASFSNFGVSTVNIGSPGVQIYSTYPGNNWARLSGTSMATPFVSGVAALMVREKPSMNGYQVKNLLFGGTNPVSSLQSRTAQKARLNAYNSITSAKSASIDPSMPVSADRSPSSTDAGQAGGCGLVTKMALDGSDKDGDGGLNGFNPTLGFFFLAVVLIAPLALALTLRQKTGRDQRRYTRYHIDSSVRVRFGDRELVGQVSTISLGGVQLNTEEWLEKGGVVKMSISSPDGRDQIEVDGQVVWSEEQKRYGVAFANTTDTVVSSINRWTKSLLKA